MWWVAAAMAVMSLVKGMKESSSLKKAARDQKDAAREAQSIADENAASLERQNIEQERRMQLQQQKEEAQSRAAASASGFESDTGSIALSLAAQQAENKKQFAYAKSVGAFNVNLTKKQGQYAYDVGSAQASATRRKASGVRLNAFMNAGKSAYGLWGGPSSGATVKSGFENYNADEWF